MAGSVTLSLSNDDDAAIQWLKELSWVTELGFEDLGFFFLGYDVELGWV